jgi:bifunctional DNA-binding transcriptional regulator/antitoxin component of YhaV-PrlF toxin-antitoxin module
MVYTLSMFNTGQITLPKTWRRKFKTKKFLAKETKEGLLIKPILEEGIVYYEDQDGFGLYGEDSLPAEEIIQKIKELNEQD